MSIEEIEQDFPGLEIGAWDITGEADDGYNCIAWAVHDTRQFWDPGLIGVRGCYWPPGVPRGDSLKSWIRAFEMNSYKVCDNGQAEHKSGGEPWVRIASSVPSARGLLKRNGLLAEGTLEAMRTQGHFHRATKT